MDILGVMRILALGSGRDSLGQVLDIEHFGGIVMRFQAKCALS